MILNDLSELTGKLIARVPATFLLYFVLVHENSRLQTRRSHSTQTPAENSPHYIQSSAYDNLNALFYS